jgi:zinc transporter ZupT
VLLSIAIAITLSTLAGAYFAKSLSKKGQTLSLYLVAFSTGVMFAVVFLSLLPQVLSFSLNTLTTFMLGFLIFYFLESKVLLHLCPEDDYHYHSLSWLSVLGLSFHALTDGMALGLNYYFSGKTVLFLALGILIHKFTEGVSIMTLQIQSKTSSTQAWIFSTLVSLAAPVGIFITFYRLKNFLTDLLLMHMLALGAGAFFYIVSRDLIPVVHQHARKENHWKLLLCFSLGLGLIALAIRLV